MAKQRKKKKHRLFWFIIKLQMVLMLVVVGGVLFYYYGGYAEQIQAIREDAVKLVRESNEYTFVPEQTSIVYAADGKMISFKKGEKEADYVKYEDIPADFVTAMVSIEDKRFYEHDGIDYIALIRSAKAIMESGELSQGGSTITMQLARNIYLDNEKRLERKIKEMFIAAELEKLYRKNKIMEFYLNNIYFANGYYGIQAACSGYFSSELNDLSLSQIAFLCAIPNSPSYYDPITHFENTIARRDRILSNMYQDGKITEADYLQAVNEEIDLNPSREEKTQMNNYVDTYVYYCATRALMELQGFEFQVYFQSDEERKDYYAAYDELYADCQKQIYAEGYKIYTSIDLEKQNALQTAVNEALASYTSVNKDGVYELQGSAVCIDNDTGYVVAIVGGREQDLGIYTLNRAYQSHRQPGSAIKPLIVYTPFFERGNNPETIVVDKEIEGGPRDGRYEGEVTVQYAVQESLNSPAWQIYEALTPRVGLQYLKNMNFTALHEKDDVIATALGGFTEGTSAVEMAAAYATLVNDGQYRIPTCIVKIVDEDENVIYYSKQEERKIYGETAARMMTNVLQTVIEKGTGESAKLENMPCAGKTGTTNEYKDGWFVGYTRYYTTSVWVGCDMPKSIEGLKGASYPAQIWQRYMSEIHTDLPPLGFLPYAQLSQEFIDTYYPQDTEETEAVETEKESEAEGLETDEEAEEEQNIPETDEGAEEKQADLETGEGAEGNQNVPEAGEETDEEQASPENEGI